MKKKDNEREIKTKSKMEKAEKIKNN